ncbi:MAG: hypothetical protein ACJ75B_03115 [Flavisolibacter sp.]
MDATTIPSVFIILLCLVCIIVVLAALRRILQKTGWTTQHRNSYFIRCVFAIVLWVAVVTVLSLVGFFRTFDLPPRVFVFVLVGLVLLLVFSSSRSFSTLLKLMPVHWPVLMQCFRILVEVMIFLSFRRGLLPIQMTWEGYNYDLITGMLALPVGWWMSKNKQRSRSVGIIFNIVGILLLLNVMVVAMLSVPTPLRYFKKEPSLALVGDLPFIYLPTILVLLAFALHIFSLKKLLKENKSDSD